MLSTLINSAQKIGAKDLGMNRRDLIETLRKDPHYTWIAEDLLQNRLSFAMNRNETSRDGIALHGFLNMFETGRTGTGMSPDERTALEAASAGFRKGDYQKQLAIDEYPLYGYLAPPVGGRLRRESGVQGYGTDTYIFKTKRVEPLATWTAGDSLDRDLEITLNGTYKTVPRLDRFMPWADRDLLLPRLFNPNPGDAPIELGLQILSSHVVLPNGVRWRYGTGSQQSYIEIQIWRKKGQGINLDDVDKFIFKKNPPSGVFLRELRRRKIEIYSNDSGKYDSEGVDRLWTEDLDAQ